MKMKKLTALALAGVLCLGMSTTVFAVDSPIPDDGDKTIEASEDISTGSGDASSTVTFTDEFGEEKEEKVIVEIEDISNEYAVKKIDEWTDKKDGAENLKKDVLAAAKADNVSIDEDAPMYYLGAGDYTVKAEYDEEQKYVLNFDLNDIPNFDKMLERQGKDATVYLMHAVTDEYGNTSFQLIKGEFVTINGTRYVQAKLDTLSPIAFVLASDGSVIPDPNPNPENPTVTPGTTGSITADQLADLIVSRLQKNTTTVVRTATNGKASPKTGE